MKIKLKSLRIILLLVAIVYSSHLFAQDNNVEMADLMHENGKIYVVVAVISVILLGFLIALISIDRRVKRMEKGTKKE